jgi:hypothetical protein
LTMATIISQPTRAQRHVAARRHRRSGIRCIERSEGLRIGAETWRAGGRIERCGNHRLMRRIGRIGILPGAAPERSSGSVASSAKLRGCHQVFRRTLPRDNGFPTIRREVDRTRVDQLPHLRTDYGTHLRNV